MHLPEKAQAGPAPVASPTPASRSPATVYLASLAPGSRRAMRQALRVVAIELTGRELDLREVPWHEVRYEHAQALRSRLAERYAPASANKILAALRGVLKEAWRLGLMDAESYRRAVDIQPVRGERVSVGREVTVGEAAVLEWLRHRGEEPGPLICRVYRGGRIAHRPLTDSSLYRAIDRRRKEAMVAPFTPMT